MTLMRWIYNSAPGVLSELIRTAFIPQEGFKFIVADFSAIEARVIVWLAGEAWREGGLSMLRLPLLGTVCYQLLRGLLL